MQHLESSLTQESESQRVRWHLLCQLDPYPSPGPLHAGTVYVSPTPFCHVGCKHCNFASRPATGPRHEQETFRPSEAQTRLLAFVNQLAAWKVVLSGGGEPLLEPALATRLVAEVTSERLEEIEIVTSGFWGKTPSSARKVLERLVVAYRRRLDCAETKFILRLSVDWFHQQALGLAPIIHILHLLDTPDFADVQCYVRSVLLLNDTTLPELATALGAHLSPLVDYQQLLTLPGGRCVPVYSKNLILDGRLSQHTLALFPVKAAPEGSIAAFSARLRDASGRFIPGLTYSGPLVRRDKGLSLDIEHDGSVRILEATAPDNVPSLYTHDWPTARAMLYADPLTIYLLEDGPEALASLLQEIRPEATHIATDTNQLYFMVKRLLNTPDVRLWATVKVLLLHRERRRYSFDDDLLQEALDYLQRRERERTT